jgi:hypothetical protein
MFDFAQAVTISSGLLFNRFVEPGTCCAKRFDERRRERLPRTVMKAAE